MKHDTIRSLILGQKLMGPETRRRDSNIKVLNSMVLKLSNTEYMPIVCLWRCFRKEESSSQPPALQKDALWGKPSCFKPPSPGRGQACVRARSVLSHQDSSTGSSWCLNTNICKCAIFYLRLLGMTYHLSASAHRKDQSVMHCWPENGFPIWYVYPVQ